LRRRPRQAEHAQQRVEAAAGAAAAVAAAAGRTRTRRRRRVGEVTRQHLPEARVRREHSPAHQM